MTPRPLQRLSTALPKLGLRARKQFSIAGQLPGDILDELFDILGNQLIYEQTLTFFACFVVQVRHFIIDELFVPDLRSSL